MALLVIGLLIWSLVHLMPSVAPGIKRAWMGRLGEGGYAASFAILIAGSLALIVLGWRSTVPALIYAPLTPLKPVTHSLMLVAFFLFVASIHATRLRRFVRHPQLTAVMVWSAAHLLQNGDSRSVALFGWLGVWALLEILFINRREGGWTKPDAPGWVIELRYGALSLILFVLAMFAHPYFTGVAIF